MAIIGGDINIRTAEPDPRDSDANPRSWFCMGCDRFVTAIHHGCPAMKQVPVSEVDARVQSLQAENERRRAHLEEHRGALELASRASGLEAENARMKVKIAYLEGELAASANDDEAFYREIRAVLGDDPDLTVTEMATNMRRHLDDAARFIAGLNLQDHPRATVQAQRAMVMKLNDVLRPQCSKNDVMAQESARALASGATHSNAAPHMPPAPATLKDETMADTIRRVFAPGQRSPIDFKIYFHGTRKKDAP